MAEWLTDGIIWKDVSFRLQHFQELSRTPGALQVRNLGPTVWTAFFVTGHMHKNAAEEYFTRLQALGGALTTLIVHTADRPRPVAIPSGGLSSVKVRSINADNDHLSLTGMPAGGRISIGDYIAILTQSGSRELVKAVGSVAANAASNTALFPVMPHLRESVAVGDAVQLVSPRMEARIEPGSLTMERVDSVLRVVSFTALQVIR